jgi:hypothetical protein
MPLPPTMTSLTALRVVTPPRPVAVEVTALTPLQGDNYTTTTASIA